MQRCPMESNALFCLFVCLLLFHLLMILNVFLFELEFLLKTISNKNSQLLGIHHNNSQFF